MIIEKNYISLGYNYWLKCLDTQLHDSTTQSSKKSTKTYYKNSSLLLTAFKKDYSVINWNINKFYLRKGFPMFTLV